MVIDILNDVVLEGLPLDTTDYDPLYNDVLASSSRLSFKAIIEKFTLDFKQSVAFEIMASSFILKSLQIEKITEYDVRTFFHNNETQIRKYTICLSGLKEKMKDMGGEEDLVMFLSGMGGTGKSEVIKAFVEFARGISLIFGWNYDTDVVKITALTGAAAYQIPNGKTLHSTACLSSTRIGKNNIDSWKSTKVIVIDEVSFLDEDNLKKSDRNMKKLKQNTNVLYGGVQVIFVGDFFQMLPVRGTPLFKNNTIQFAAINKAFF